MQIVKVDRPVAPSNSTNKFISAAIILVILLVVALYINNTYKAFQSASLPQKTVMISQSMLEQKYGLRVSLIAVTAAGGMVDMRLKFVDAEKARSLLKDKKNFPALLVGESKIRLNASEETQSQEIKFENDGNLFLLFPNTGNAIKTGTPVTLVFGDIALEPIEAR